MRSRLLAGTAAAVAVSLWAAAGAAWGADTPPPSSVHQTDPLGPVRAAIARQHWDEALNELRKMPMPGSADWHNLMGYAWRKRATPDLVAAQRHYDTALRLDPDHKGALEYAGELALMKGDLATAEAHLARLVRLCAAGCEERADLERALARFKDSGSRPRP
ncbi:MAG: tetratricopeptide repeat protein [Rubrivivax sp.]|nr:tetratricopeptide repeat protein [Rubrivivax sp.]